MASILMQVLIVFLSILVPITLSSDVALLISLVQAELSPTVAAPAASNSGDRLQIDWWHVAGA